MFYDIWCDNNWKKETKGIGSFIAKFMHGEIHCQHIQIEKVSQPCINQICTLDSCIISLFNSLSLSLNIFVFPLSQEHIFPSYPIYTRRHISTSYQVLTILPPLLIALGNHASVLVKPMWLFSIYMFMTKINNVLQFVFVFKMREFEWCTWILNTLCTFYMRFRW